jgi:hypothetical protein
MYWICTTSARCCGQVLIKEVKLLRKEKAKKKLLEEYPGERNICSKTVSNVRTNISFNVYLIII